MDWTIFKLGGFVVYWASEAGDIGVSLTAFNRAVHVSHGEFRYIPDVRKAAAEREASFARFKKQCDEVTRAHRNSEFKQALRNMSDPDYLN